MTGISGALLLLWSLVVIGLPLVVNQQQINDKIEAGLSRRLGGKVQFRAVQTSLIPLEAEISEVRLVLPRISGSADSNKAAIGLRPLLRGKAAHS